MDRCKCIHYDAPLALQYIVLCAYRRQTKPDAFATLHQVVWSACLNSDGIIHIFIRSSIHQPTRGLMCPPTHRRSRYIHDQHKVVENLCIGISCKGNLCGGVPLKYRWSWIQLPVYSLSCIYVYNYSNLALRTIGSDSFHYDSLWECRCDDESGVS